MSFLAVDSKNSLYYELNPPLRDNAPTFVFINALTGNIDTWEAMVAPALREQGFGTLCYNFRGQDKSTFEENISLTPQLIVDDLKRLVVELTPSRPVLVGLSIGGLFAAHAYLQGLKVDGLVLLNTLREIGPRIAWINDAMPTIVAAGGVNLFLDALFPLLVNPDFATKARQNFLTGDYIPLPPTHGYANLMQHAASADWDIKYEDLDLPTCVITGHHDRVFLDPDIVDRLYARLPNARREDWDDAGHLLPQERPENLIVSLATFGAEIEADR